MSSESDYRDSHTGEGKGEHYDCYYESDPWPAFMWKREQIVLDDLLKKHFGGREIKLLDFACGTGRITSFLESRVNTCVGVDLSESMLSIARTKLQQTELITADLTSEDALAGRQFNLITAFRFFTNAQPQLREQVIKKLTEHLEPAGLLLFNNHHVPEALYFQAERVIQRLRGRSRPAEFRMMSLEETSDLAELAGLQIIETRHVGFLHLPRVTFPTPLLDGIESAIQHINWLARRSESVLVVCERKP